MNTGMKTGHFLYLLPSGKSCHLSFAGAQHVLKCVKPRDQPSVYKAERNPFPVAAPEGCPAQTLRAVIPATRATRAVRPRVRLNQCQNSL